MVKQPFLHLRQPIFSVFVGLLLCMFQTVCYGAIKAHVDRTQVSENESLRLTITGDLTVSSGIDMLSLNTLSVPQPDTKPIEQDFEILDRQQNYQVEIINGKNNSVITWQYTLMPKRTGDLTIPAIEYENETSNPINIKVTKADKSTSPENKLVFLETEVDLSEVYVQQQFIFKVRLYYAMDLTGGNLDQPQHKDAQFTLIGKQKEFTRYVGNQRYDVVERTYAVFPKVAGDLVISPLKFNGSFIKRRYGRRIFRKEQTDPVTIKVKSPVAGFTGNVWLPAQSLHIRDRWSNPAREIKVGDSLTRTISMVALGLEGVQLPPLHSVDLDGLKVYPEPAKVDTEHHAAGLNGLRDETQALIATKPGVYTLPEIRIPWWDVLNDKEKVAIIPSRVITVVAGPGRTAASPDPTPALSMQNQVNQSQNLSTNNAQNQLISNTQTYSLIWQITTGLFLALWLITLYAWWRKPKAPASAQVNAVNAPQPVITLDLLDALAREGSSEFSIELIRWLEQSQKRGALSLKLVDIIKSNTRPQINQIQRNQYGPEETKADSSIMLAVLDQVRSLLKQEKQGKEDKLGEFYPS